MSAFMVDDKVINRVVCWLAHRNNEWERDHVLKVAELSVSDPEWQEKLGASMFQLNMDGVNARYGEGESAHFRPLDYKFNLVMTTDVQTLKSLQCWLYQCSEGDVTERPLFQEFSRLAGSIAIDIVRRMDCYERAEW